MTSAEDRKMGYVDGVVEFKQPICQITVLEWRNLMIWVIIKWLLIKKYVPKNYGVLYVTPQ